MDDTKTLQDAYADELSGLFSVLFRSLAAAGGDKAEEAKAEEAFKSGLAVVRRARDKALEFVK